MSKTLDSWFQLSSNEEENLFALKIKDVAVTLSSSEIAELSEKLHDYQPYFFKVKLKALRMAGKVDEAISMLHRTDMGNRIGYDYENSNGPTRDNLITSGLLHECSEEWLAEQLNEPLEEVKKMLVAMEEEYQSHDEHPTQEEIEESHKALIERHKLWGLDAVPLHLADLF